ncbi:MAG: GNAT family N-acetyltransferase [Acutalibacteraceae bacterium]|nr:GNAT family N-acetyltransferase [Acutalibacteraceae bacterium]
MLIGLKENDFDNMYNILKESFPKAERRTKQGQKALFKKECYKVFAIRDNDSCIKAFITVYDLNFFAFVEHFAVSKNYRNQGLGALVLTELKKMIKKPVILEVEPPDTDMAKRRIEFYKRNGFFLNDYFYEQLPLRKGQSNLTLKIMSSDKQLSKEEFEDVKRIIYKQVYDYTD